MIEKEVEIIDIDKEAIPYSFIMSLDNKDYDITVNYNTVGDYFTLEFYIDDRFITKEKLVYGMPLFRHLQHRNDVPRNVVLLPFSPTEEQSKITYENLGVSTFLYILEVV